MTIKLPRIIQEYVDASNKHDVASILSCFSDDARVHDEGETLNGKKSIEDWLIKTIQKYKFHFKPFGLKGDGGAEVVVAMEVAGTFDGSPVALDYQFVINNDRILSLAVH